MPRHGFSVKVGNRELETEIIFATSVIVLETFVTADTCETYKVKIY